MEGFVTSVRQLQDDEYIKITGNEVTTHFQTPQTNKIV